MKQYAESLQPVSLVETFIIFPHACFGS